MKNNITGKTKVVTVVTLATVMCVVPSSAPAQTLTESSECMSRCEYVVTETDFEVVTDSKLAAWVDFQNLRRQWVQERGARSSVLEMASMPSYLNILGMGPAVVPMILTQLKSEGDKPDHWFLALAAITRENPVSPQNRGRVREMAKAWLEWGASKGYVQLG
jgi:hypothetical protein